MRISQESGGNGRKSQNSFSDMMGRENRSGRGGRGASQGGGRENSFSKADQQKIAQKFNDGNTRIETIRSNTGIDLSGTKSEPLTGRFAPSSESKGSQSVEQSMENRSGRGGKGASQGRGASQGGGSENSFSKADQQKIAQKFNETNQRIKTIASNTGIDLTGTKSEPLTGRFAPSSETKNTQTIEQFFENRPPRSEFENIIDNA